MFFNKENIMVFPSSNSIDAGKLVTEENIRDITRKLTNKNYRINNGLELTDNESSGADLYITEGEAIINGYHVSIVNSTSHGDPIKISDRASSSGDYFIYLKLIYNNAGNILYGDIGVNNFTGLSVVLSTTDPYEDNSISDKRNIMLLGTVTYDGSSYSDLHNIDDNDYMIGADSILLNNSYEGKYIDSNTNERVRVKSLDTYMSNIDNWFVSKFGDKVYGNIEMKNGTYTPITNNVSEWTDIGTTGTISSGDYNSGIGSSFTSMKDTYNSVSLLSGNIGIGTDYYGITGMISGVERSFMIGYSNNTNDLGIYNNNYDGSISLKLSNGTLFEMFDNSASLRNANNSSYIKFDPEYSSGNNSSISIGRVSSGSNTKYLYLSPNGITIKSGSQSTDDVVNIPRIASNIADITSISTSSLSSSGTIKIGTRTMSDDSGTLSIDGGLKSSGNILGASMTSTGTLSANNINVNNSKAIIDSNGGATLSSLNVANVLIANSNSVSSSKPISVGSTTINSSSINLANKVTLAVNSNNVMTIDKGVAVTGNLTATKVYNAVWNDYADALEADNIEDMKPGDLISKLPGSYKYTKSNLSNRRLVVGVYSDTYGHLLGGSGSEEETLRTHVPVAVAGNVRAKILGKVTEGDLITVSSIPGVGEKAITVVPGTIVGKALENKDTTGVGRVLIQVMLS